MLKVALSPFFGAPEFHDEVSGLTFQRGRLGEMVIYDITNEVKLSGIRSAVRMNILLLVAGELPTQGQEAQTPKSDPVVEQVEVKEPAQEKAPAEVVQEEKPEAKPVKTTKKK